MNCEHYLELMSAALDGECTAEERRALDSHLAVCPECADLFRILSANANAARELDCEMPADLKSRIMNNLPEQEKAAKQGKVISLKRWIPVAAAARLVLVISLIPGTLGGGKNSAPEAAMDQIAVRDSDAYSIHDTAEEPMADPGLPQELVICVYGNPQSIRVSYGATPKAGAVIIDSAEALDAYLDQFNSQCWDNEGNLLPMAELDALKETYTEYWFRNFRLLCVVVESGSGSNRYEIYPYSNDRNVVTVVEEVPEVGTCDMAAWLLVAEVDDSFSSDDTPVVKFTH